MSVAGSFRLRAWAQWLHAMALAVVFLSGGARGGCPTDLLALEEDCANAISSGAVTCDESTGHVLYRYTNLGDQCTTFNMAGSCSACDCGGYTGEDPDAQFEALNEWFNTGPKCCMGWNGTQCDLCSDVSVCPPRFDEKTNTTQEAYACSSDTVVAQTRAEALEGKRFSCVCGGGEDQLSRAVCPLQGQYCEKYEHYNDDPDNEGWQCNSAKGSFATRFDWTFTGIGSDDEPGTIKLEMNAGIKGMSFEWQNPGQFDYYWPIVWAGDLSNCKITEGKCLAVPGTDVSKKDCYNFHCGDTQVHCPPEGFEECPGGANNCDDVPHDDDSVKQQPYLMHKCNAVPVNDIEFDISCLKEKQPGGSFVCYYYQGDSGLSAPMSMTCNVGQCLYNTSNTTNGDIDYDTSELAVPDNIVPQLRFIAVIAAATLFFFLVVEFTRRMCVFRSDALYRRFLKGREGQGATEPSVDEGATMAEPLLSEGEKEFPGAAVESGAEVEWRSVNLWVPDPALSSRSRRSSRARIGERQILHDVNGKAPKGSVTALMGPSGAGKTSLLDCLAARKKMHRVDRQVTVNGGSCPPKTMQAVSGYVEQHDILPSMFTVREHLLFHARLRCGRLTTLDRRRRVESVVKTLNLSKCGDTMIGGESRRGLSGGERRRLSVAEELLLEPRILFLDEPTTGLDSSTAMELVRTLVGLAGRGQTVLLSIHQPRKDIFEMFDHVIVLCKGGRVVYEGGVENVGAYLQRASALGLATLMEGHERLNPADVLLDVASESDALNLAAAVAHGALSDDGQVRPSDNGIAVVGAGAIGAAHDTNEVDEEEARGAGAELIEVLPDAVISLSVVAKEAEDALSSEFLKTAKRRMANPVVQFVVLSTRLVQTAVRHPMLLCLQYFGALFLAVALGSVFADVQADLYGVQDRFGVLFFIPFCLVLLGMSSLPVWRDENILFNHEYGNKRIYDFPAYFLSVIFFDLVLVRTVPPLAFALISYKQIGLNKYCDDCLYTFALVLVLTNVISALVAMTIGAFQCSPSFSNLIGSILSLGFALFGGFLVNREQMKHLPLYDFDPLAYSYEALMINEFGNQKDKSGNTFYYVINGSWCAKGLETIQEPGNTLLSTFGFASSQRRMKFDIYSLWTGALYCVALAFTVLLVSSKSTDGAVIIKRCLLRFLRYFSSSSNRGASASFDGAAVRLTEDTVDSELSRSLVDSPTLSIPADESINDSREDNSEVSEFSVNLSENPALIVVSFHDIVYEAPGGVSACFRRKYVESDKSADSASSSSITSVGSNSSIGSTSTGASIDSFIENDCVSRIVLLGVDEIMGMNILHRVSDDRAVVRTVMEGTWAHKNGVRPMDVINQIGGRICTYAEVTTRLETEQRPIEIELLRKKPTPKFLPRKKKGDELNGDDDGRKDNAILHGISGSTVPCDALLGLPSPLGPMYTAIMGPSGAGKTTLLDILAGRKASGAVRGSVCLNGHPVKPREMRQISGYVTQEDILPGALTVAEYLAFQARLRISRRRPGVRGDVRKRAVSKRLEQLNLTGCADSSIGNEFVRGISGGEKRRVSVAVELLSEPAILFLDEPTTGLDSTTAVNLTSILRNIALEGTTVIMSIHQPRLEIFEMITQVIMLTKDGRVGYCGPTSALGTYISDDLAAVRVREPSPEMAPLSHSAGGAVEQATQNPADLFLDEMRSRQPRDIAGCFQSSRIGETQAGILAALVGEAENEHAPGLTAACADLGMGRAFKFPDLLSRKRKFVAPWRSQLWALSLRCLRNVLRNPYLLVVHGVTATACAVVLGFVFWDIHQKDDETAGMQDRLGIMFFLVIYLSLLALTSLPVWREEQRLFKAERGSGIYGASSYVVATIFFDVLPYRILPPLLFTYIAYPMIKLNDNPGHQYIFLLTLIFFNLVVSGLCMLVGVLTSSNSSANAAGSLVMLTSILFCG